MSVQVRHERITNIVIIIDINRQSTKNGNPTRESVSRRQTESDFLRLVPSVSRNNMTSLLSNGGFTRLFVSDDV